MMIMRHLDDISTPREAGVMETEAFDTVQSASRALDVATSGSFDEYELDFKVILGSNYDVLYSSDADGVTRKVGEACKELWGLKPCDLVGKSVFELERDGIYQPSVTRMVLESGRRIQSLQITRTGRKLLVVGTPIKDGRGRIIQVVNLSWNITDDAGPETEGQNAGRLFDTCGRVLCDAFSGRNELNGFVYASESMAKVAHMALKMSRVDSTVLITGESGVGKEVIASFIHSNSERSRKPFIKVNCAAIPESLMESEFFGYERGAFTGANKDGKPGVFELAEKGTLLLDEISETAPNIQVKLLRVLQDGTFMRVGGVKPSRADVRIIAASNKDLEAEMRHGRFREDLFYRLNVIPFHIPPLRQRPDDIPLLALFFLKRYNERYDKNKIFDAKTIKCFQKHEWRGNIRELQNIVERLVILTDGDLISVPDLPPCIAGDESERAVAVNRIMPMKDAVNMVERQLVLMAMEKYGTTTRAAEALGVDQSTISRKLRKV
jgi:transcriptional regulator with PAS, ATPase and Fis domain